jgi:hypothetical protein
MKKPPGQRDVCCPVLKLLANMGIIKPSNITSVDLKRGLDMLGFENGDDSPFLKILRKVSNKYGTVNFATLNLHHGPGGECDASLTRCDYHIGDSVHVIRSVSGAWLHAHQMVAIFLYETWFAFSSCCFMSRLRMSRFK